MSISNVHILCQERPYFTHHWIFLALDFVALDSCISATYLEIVARSLFDQISLEPLALSTVPNRLQARPTELHVHDFKPSDVVVSLSMILANQNDRKSFNA